MTCALLKMELFASITLHFLGCLCHGQISCLRFNLHYYTFMSAWNHLHKRQHISLKLICWIKRSVSNCVFFFLPFFLTQNLFAYQLGYSHMHIFNFWLLLTPSPPSSQGPQIVQLSSYRLDLVLGLFSIQGVHREQATVINK